MHSRGVSDRLLFNQNSRLLSQSEHVIKPLNIIFSLITSFLYVIIPLILLLGLGKLTINHAINR